MHKTLLSTLMLLIQLGGDSMAYTVNKDRDMVVKTMLGEGLGEGLNGMTAIGETIRNRAVKRKLTPAQVVSQPKQYSFWNNPVKASAWLKKYANAKAYQIASQAYDAVFTNNSNITNGATHYFNPKLAHPSWAKKLKAKGLIGQHAFYEE